jgi:alginate O-acetyltransferase complex protein AlgI
MMSIIKKERGYVLSIWIKSLLILVIFKVLNSELNLDTIYDSKNIIYQSLLILIFGILINYYKFKSSIIIPYVLFFSITFTSMMGLSKILTGSYSENSNIYFYGMSFYTLTFAYLFKTKKINLTSSINATNPLLLITGPIAISIIINKNKSLINRFNYYFPYIVLGVFLFQIIATPLTQLFELKSQTDLISTFIFALIFEIFVYSNFCGLSLIIYGILGVLGIKIPLNFKQPFSGSNLIEFWRGWHISLSIVLRELFYSPIKKKFGRDIALIGVFLSSALWHGISLNFIYWGLFHSLCFIFTLYLINHNLKFISIIIFILAIPFSRILSSESNNEILYRKLLFKFEDFNAFHLINSHGMHVKMAIIFGVTFILLEIICKNNKFFLSRRYKFYRIPAVQYFILILIILFIYQSGNGYAVYGQR